MVELSDLLPIERMAHRICVERLRRGDDLQANTTAALGMAPLRLMGVLDNEYEVIP